MPCERKSTKMEDKKQFVLVHGACHGGWCWYKLVSLLKSAGHRVTALDLGGSGINPKRVDELKSFSDYVEPLMEFMASVPEAETVILVGHSYGGLAVSLAMENFPEKISVVVFVTACVSKPGDAPGSVVQEFFRRTPPESLLDCQVFIQDNLPISVVLGPMYLETTMYQNCKSEDMELAKMVVRPFKFFLKDLGSESLLSEDRYGKVNRVFVECKEDGIVKQELVGWMIKNSSTQQVESIDGADHMVMLSKPTELCKCLLEIASKYCPSSYQ